MVLVVLLVTVSAIIIVPIFVSCGVSTFRTDQHNSIFNIIFFSFTGVGLMAMGVSILKVLHSVDDDTYYRY